MKTVHAGRLEITGPIIDKNNNEVLMESYSTTNAVLTFILTARDTLKYIPVPPNVGYEKTIYPWIPIDVSNTANTVPLDTYIAYDKTAWAAAVTASESLYITQCDSLIASLTTIIAAANQAKNDLQAVVTTYGGNLPDIVTELNAIITSINTIISISEIAEADATAFKAQLQSQQAV